MPSSVNGFGTSYHGGAAPVRWEKPEGISRLADHDAVECAIALGFPIFPFAAVHTYNWEHRSCRTVRLRRTPALLLRALLRPYLLAVTWPAGVLFVGAGLMAAGVAILGKLGNAKPEFWTFLWVDGAIAFAGVCLLTMLRKVFSRSRDIRLVMGPHEWGSSDPALWFTPPTPELLEANSWEASREALQQGQFSKAMFGARVLLAQDEVRGEALTDEILADPRVTDALPELRRRPWRRQELFPSDASLRIPLDQRRSFAGGAGASVDAGLHT